MLMFIMFFRNPLGCFQFSESRKSALSGVVEKSEAYIFWRVIILVISSLFFQGCFEDTVCLNETEEKSYQRGLRFLKEGR